MAINFLQNVSLNGAELQNFVIHNLGSAPTAIEGRLYFDTSGGGGSHDLKLYINGAWTSILDTTLSVATSSTLGGIKIGYTENGKNYPVELSSEQAFVNVPWTDTVYSHPSHPGDDASVDTGALTGATVISDLDFNITTDTLGHVTDANASVATRTLTLANLGYTGATDANNYSLPLSDSATRGGMKIGYSENGKNYPVELSSEKAYVNVPWTDTDVLQNISANEEDANQYITFEKSSSIGYVKLEYSLNGGQSWMLITASTYTGYGTTGSYLWSVKLLMHVSIHFYKQHR